MRSCYVERLLSNSRRFVMTAFSRRFSHLLFHIVFLLLISSGLPAAKGQFIQQGGKLVDAEAVGIAVQGQSVALSADGNTAIIGAPGDGVTGSTLVFTRSGGVWSQQGRLVGTGAVGSAGTQQGGAVALAADGNTAIVGGFGDNRGAQDNRGVGAAWVFARSGGIWSQQGSKLVGTGAIGFAAQGYSVALSADGNTAVVGGPNDNNPERANADNGRDTSGTGAAWVYTRSGSEWSQQGSKLVGADANSIAGQGSSVALSADGNTALVGGPNASIASDVGAVWVYTRSGGLWSQQGSKLIGTGVDGCCAEQGQSVALSADGNTAMVGGLNDQNGGSVWVYTRLGGVWSQQGSKLVGTGAVGNASQGISVAVSADGNTAIVGGYGDDNFAGAAWVYTRSGSVWNQLGGKIVGTGATAGPGQVGGFAQQGRAVALSADGNTAIVGGPTDNGYLGAAWVFVKLVVSTVPSILTDGTGIINGASYVPGNIVSGSWVSVKGAGFTDLTVDWSSFDFSTGLLPTTLNGVQVFFNGQPGAVWYVITGTPQQINVQAPANLNGLVSVQVSRNGVLSNTVTTTAVQVAPAFFAYTLDNGKTFFPSAVFLDGTLLGDPAILPGARKAKAGDKVLLFANSLAPSPAGVVAVSGTTHAVNVTIGSASLPVDFSGLIGPGEFMITITVPLLTNNGNYPITLQIDGQSSQPGIVFPYTN
jgi:uncharacterized protein (TIGR03437 family)